MNRAQEFTRLDAKRREQTPQALARLVVVTLFVGLWLVLWVARIPMPLPFLIALLAEIVFFLIYWRAVFFLPSVRTVSAAQYAMLGAEIVFHTTMVYFLGSLSWMGAFAYCFGLIFTNAFLDLRRGLVYTAGACSAFASLVLLEATGVIPHYVYLEQGPLRYADARFVATSLVGGVGVFFSIYLWSSWVGHQLRRERDSAVRAQDELLHARFELLRANEALEERVHARTAELRQNEAVLKSTIESTADGILVVDCAGQVTYANGRFAEMWHIPPPLLATHDDDKLLQFVLDQLQQPQAFLAKVRELYQSTMESLDDLSFKDGRVFERYSRPLMVDGQVAGRVWSFRDVTQRKVAEELLNEQARRDPLTGLLNRRAGLAAVEERIAHARRTGGRLAVLILDLDRFKLINDRYSHETGDAALIRFAEVMAALTGERGVICRLGGDEFEIALTGIDTAGAVGFAERLRVALELSLNDDRADRLPPFTVSTGIACYPDDGDSNADLARRADEAMYAAKAGGGDSICVWRQLGNKQVA